MEQKTILDKIKVPTFLCVELNLFGGARAFQLLRAFLDYGFKGVEPKKGDLDEEQTKYYTDVLRPIIDKQKAEQRKRERRKERKNNNKQV
jgi:hypothetical protein